MDLDNELFPLFPDYYKTKQKNKKLKNKEKQEKIVLLVFTVPALFILLSCSKTAFVTVTLQGYSIVCILFANNKTLISTILKIFS